MTLVFPNALAADTANTAWSRGAAWFAGVLLLATMSCLVVLQLAAPNRTFWPALFGLGVIAGGGLLIATLRRGRAAVLVVAFIVVAIGTFLYADAAFALLRANTASDMIFLSFPKVAVVLLGVIAGRWMSGVVACILAFTIAEGTVFALATATAHPYTLDVSVTATFVMVVLALVLLRRSRRRSRSSEPELSRGQDEELLALGVRRERSASSALLHDTVLNELAVISTTAPGRLSAAAQQQIARSLAITDAAGDVPAGEYSAALADIISWAEQNGLEVTVTGDLSTEASLAPEKTVALALAVQQCLQNVIRHSGTMQAEIAVLTTGDQLSVLVIDGGVGFSPETVAADRLGLSGSVRHRVEAWGGTVQVWSTPGAGTAVSLAMPIDAAVTP